MGSPPVAAFPLLLAIGCPIDGGIDSISRLGSIHKPLDRLPQASYFSAPIPIGGLMEADWGMEAHPMMLETSRV